MEPSLHEQYVRFCRNELKAEELESFLQQATLAENKEMVKEWMDNTWNELAEMNVDKINETTVVPLRNTRRFLWKRWLAAASIILALALGSYFLYTDQPTSQNQVVKAEDPADIKAPESNRAMITLSDGRRVYLDSAGNGTLASQSGTNVIKTADGQIIYDGMSPNLSKADLIYNTLTNPRGSKVIDMQLSDGSRIWLNAGSSVTYPVAFAGNERKVEISGEAYFEVAHDKSKPFKVTKGDLEVAVLGTHFNVNAYDDEANIKVTLLEGKVQVASTNSKYPNSKFLLPGQQAILSQVEGNKSTIQLIKPDLEHVMAWKNGLFILNATDMQSLMKQVARWYDVDIMYISKVPPRKFGGTISRSVNLSTLLQALNEQGVDVKLEGRKVTVGEQKKN